MRATEPEHLLVARLSRTDLFQRLLRRDRASLSAGCVAPAYVAAASQRSTEPPGQRTDEWSRQVSEREEEYRNQDGPPRQPSREVNELDLQHLWRETFGREERKPERVRIAPRLAHLPTRGRWNHLINLEM